jgi:hypothetical protein
MPISKSRRLLKKLPEIITEKLDTRDPEDHRPILLFAQDEGRFGRISDVRRAWSPLGMRPQAPRQVIRTYLYVFTAVCPALGKMTSLILLFRWQLGIRTYKRKKFMANAITICG